MGSSPIKCGIMKFAQNFVFYLKYEIIIRGFMSKVQQLRIAGVAIDENKYLSYALMKVKGIGLSTAKKMQTASGIESTKKVVDLSDEERQKVISVVERFIGEGLKLEEDLIRYVQDHIRTKIILNTSVGKKLASGISLYGRTHSNNKTAKKFGKMRSIYKNPNKGGNK
jgi:small subunit ribosomal protein S13